MNQHWLLHDSHNADFRRPFGAVACHSRIRLVLSITSEAPWAEAVQLRLWQDGVGETILDMALVRQEGGRRYYEAVIIAPATPGVVWYYFIVRQCGQLYYYGNNAAQTGGVGQITDSPPPSYQISVYLPGAATPRWFKHAVVYQIFVDRFYNGLPDGQILNPRPGCLLHADWYDTPVYTRAMDSGAILAYDFFGGNLAGVIAKLPYLEDLGITAIYFNPIFASPSNHKYDTADYQNIDPMFGDNALFAELCAQARKRGIAIILDGVFSHTGSDSIYFNQAGTYDSVGACQSTDSPYYSWYKFTEYPDKYECWWGIDNLPNVNEEDPSYQQFIMEGPDSILSRWLQLGIKGWRLDVADELPESFLKRFYKELKAADPDAVLIGEVWEDASHKVAYGSLRQYFDGTALDSVMNYPFRKLILDYVLGWREAEAVHRDLFSLYENYPKENFYANLNIIGSHDVPRILTLLAEAPAEEEQSKLSVFKHRLTPAQRRLGLARLKLVVLWQMTFPGAPCIYYGDEAGLEGYSDPLNRRTYPWGREDQELLSWYKMLVKLRRSHTVLRTGEWLPLIAAGDVYAYVRRIRGGQDVFGDLAADNTALIILNRSRDRHAVVSIDTQAWFADQAYIVDAVTGEQVMLSHEQPLELTLPPITGRVLMASLAEPALEQSRCSGILLHPSSLPGPFGIGDLGPEAYRFVDFLSASEQRIWQFLPLNPAGYGDSPYQCLSAFAGNPLLISPEALAASGLLTSEDLADHPFGQEDIAQVDFRKVKKWKDHIFRQAFAHFMSQGKSSRYNRFVEQTADWLNDYTLFIALKKYFRGVPWTQWDQAIRQRDADAILYYRQTLEPEMAYQAFLQFVFWEQWHELKAYANKQGLLLFGDLPLFVAHDSADVWSNPTLFALDSAGNPAKVAGVPPDYFSTTGQLWGNPLYNWEIMAEDDYSWWRRRLTMLLAQVDMIRIDHFRGFEAYWEIPAGEETAEYGRWVNGPGAKFFAVLEKYFGKMPLVAEDLGVITAGVNRLKHQFGYPGMKVLQFSFGQEGIAPDFPQNTGINTIAYTGTHDNDTLAGWWQALANESPELRRKIKQHLAKLDLLDGESDDAVREGLIRLTFLSQAGTVILPLQDVLGLGNDARMNTPGTVGDNWTWRLLPETLSKEVAGRLAGWTNLGGRGRNLVLTSTFENM